MLKVETLDGQRNHSLARSIRGLYDQFNPQRVKGLQDDSFNLLYEGIHETDPAFILVVFCLTKKADSTLLLRTGTRTISRRFWLSNDLNAVKGLDPSI